MIWQSVKTQASASVANHGVSPQIAAPPKLHPRLLEWPASNNLSEKTYESAFKKSNNLNLEQILDLSEGAIRYASYLSFHYQVLCVISFIPLPSVTQPLLYDMMSLCLNAIYSRNCVIRALQLSEEDSHALESAISNHHRKLHPKLSEWLAHFNLQENVYEAAFKKANYCALERVIKLSDVEVK